MVFLLRKKATTNAKAAAAKENNESLPSKQSSNNAPLPKVVNGEAISAMSIQYDADRIKQSNTYAPSTSTSSSIKQISSPIIIAPSSPSRFTSSSSASIASTPSEPIDQLLARAAAAENQQAYTSASAEDGRKDSSSTTKPSAYRRTSSAQASITAHSQTLPSVHSTIASTSSTTNSNSYYPSSSTSSHTASPITNQSNSYYQPPSAAAASSSSTYGYYRSPQDETPRRDSASSASSYAASEASDILHNSVGGRSSSGGTTATTPGSTIDKEYASAQRKNSLIANGAQQQASQTQTQTQAQQIQQASQSQARPSSSLVERVPVPSTSSSSTNSSSQTQSTNRMNKVRPASELSQHTASPALSSSSSFARKTTSRYTLTDFQFQRTLGTGSFGRVHLVRSCHNMRFYAVKVLNKERVVRMKQVEHTNSEREMLERVRHPFLVNLWGTFKDSQNLYMVMDFVSGGELFSLLRKSQRFPDAVAKFFAAEVALALDYLHSLDIIYRDLKPENILLAADGHVKITDFGFAKYVPDITWTLCGTPDYLAPEIVQSKGYNKSVDWYALGVLIFEMLAGYPPFFTEDSNPMRLYEKIIAGKVRYPSYFTEEAKDLLRNLLTSDLTKRFGNLANGSRDIFGHQYFVEVDWNRLYRKEIPAPYVPRVDGDGDSSNFDTYAEIDVNEYGIVGTDPHGHLFTCF